MSQRLGDFQRQQLLTTAEQCAETRIRRLRDSTWEQVGNLLIAQWVLTAVFVALFLAAGVGGALLSVGLLPGVVTGLCSGPRAVISDAPARPDGLFAWFSVGGHGAPFGRGQRREGR